MLDGDDRAVGAREGLLPHRARRGDPARRPWPRRAAGGAVGRRRLAAQRVRRGAGAGDGPRRADRSLRGLPAHARRRRDRAAAARHLAAARLGPQTRGDRGVRHPRARRAAARRAGRPVRRAGPAGHADCARPHPGRAGGLGRGVAGSRREGAAGAARPRLPRHGPTDDDRPRPRRPAPARGAPRVARTARAVPKGGRERRRRGVCPSASWCGCSTWRCPCSGSGCCSPCRRRTSCSSTIPCTSGWSRRSRSSTSASPCSSTAPRSATTTRG